jgi:hypothetical protein
MSEFDEERHLVQRQIVQDVVQCVDAVLLALKDAPGGMPIAFFTLTILLDQCEDELKRQNGAKYWAKTKPRFRRVAQIIGELYSEEAHEHTPEQREANVIRVLQKLWALHPKG